MNAVNSPTIQHVSIAAIEADERMRPVSEAGVESLMASITELGVIKDAIHIRRKGRGDKAKLILMAGAHRLEAAKRLGWDAIPALVWADVTNDFARLMEIDDNLAGADLSNLELAVFLAERKKVYERLHPETKAGVAGGKAKHGSATEIISFAESVAEKRELSARHIRNFVQIGNALSSWEIKALAAMQAPPKLKDLMALAKISEDHIRVDAIDKLKHGTAKSIDDAIAQITQKPEANNSPENPTETALKELLTAWKRTPSAARRRFVAEAFGDLYPLIVASQSREAAE